MSYSTDLAKLLSAQFSKFITLNRHQLAGHIANLDFWLDELRHSLATIDGYRGRFENLKTAQKLYVDEHNTKEFELIDPCCTERPASRPVRVRDRELSEARRSLCDVAYRFLARCCKEGLLSVSALQGACSSLGIGVETGDFGLSQ